MKNTKNIIIGIVIVAIGVLLLLKSLGVIDNLNIFFDGWWTLLIIVPAFIGLLTEKDKTGDLIALAIGILLLLGARDLIDFDLVWRLMFPIIIIIFGLSMIFKNFFQAKVKDELSKINSKDLQNYTAMFSAQNIKINDEEFKGSDMNAIFGGIDLDLRNAKFPKDTKIKMCCVFGGVDIFVPEDVNVKIVSNSFFGGVDDKRKNTNKESKHTLYIEATCIFGGVDIK